MPVTPTDAIGHPNRWISDGDRSVEVAIDGGAVRWVGAQEHRGEHLGTPESHAIFIELKEPARSAAVGAALGPTRRS
jgi:beta-alanine degradation protein BauB